MAQYDASVLSQIPDYAPNPVQAQQNALTLANAAQGYQAGQLELGEKRRSLQEDAQIREALKGADLSTFEGQTKAAQAITKISPEKGMKFMAGANQQQTAAGEVTLQKLELADKKMDILAGALDPAIAQLDVEARRPGANPAMLDAKTKQLVIPALLQLKRDHPELEPEIQRFLADPNHLTYQGARSVDEQTKRGSQAIKDRISQMQADTAARKQDETERENRTRDSDRDRKRTEGSEELSPAGQALKDELTARDPSFLAKSKVGAAQMNQQIERWAKEGKTADDIVGSRQGTKGTAAEVTALTKQKAGLERTEKSIVSPGGFLDQAESAVKEVDLSKVKSLGKLESWRKEQMSDPALQNYHTRLTELRAEYAIVLSKGGQVTDAARTEAAEVVPDYMTPESFARVKQAIQQGVAASSRAVDDSIAEATHTRSTPAGAGGGGGNPPPASAAAPAGGQGWGKATVVGQ